MSCSWLALANYVYHGAKMKKCQNHPCDTFTQKKRILPNKNPKELNQQLQLQKTQKLLAWKEILKSKNKGLESNTFFLFTLWKKNLIGEEEDQIWRKVCVLILFVWEIPMAEIWKGRPNTPPAAAPPPPPLQQQAYAPPPPVQGYPSPSQGYFQQPFGYPPQQGKDWK